VEIKKFDNREYVKSSKIYEVIIIEWYNITTKPIINHGTSLKLLTVFS